MNAITPTAAEVPHVEGAIRNPDNPHHFMVIKPQDRRVRVYLGDKLLADTTGAVQLIEIGKTAYEPAFYVPAADLSVDFQRSGKTTHCPLKGDAGYVVLAIFAFGLITILYAEEFVSGSNLSRALSAYIATFWGIRLMLQGVFDLRSSLDAAWKRCGFHLLTIAFLYLTLVYAAVAFGLQR